MHRIIYLYIYHAYFNSSFNSFWERTNNACYWGMEIFFWGHFWGIEMQFYSKTHNFLFFILPRPIISIDIKKIVLMILLKTHFAILLEKEKFSLMLSRILHCTYIRPWLNMHCVYGISRSLIATQYMKWLYVTLQSYLSIYANI